MIGSQAEHEQTARFLSWLQKRRDNLTREIRQIELMVDALMDEELKWLEHETDRQAAERRKTGSQETQ